MRTLASRPAVTSSPATPTRSPSRSRRDSARRRPPQPPGAPPTAATGSVGYVLQVKDALAGDPAAYRKFTALMQRYHDQRSRSGVPRDQNTTSGDLEALRDVVFLLRMRPNLVLGFNDFVTDGYRIRMFDSSAYVIEHPGGILRVPVRR